MKDFLFKEISADKMNISGFVVPNWLPAVWDNIWNVILSVVPNWSQAVWDNIWNVIGSVIGGVGAFLVAIYTFRRGEKKDIEDKQTQNEQDLFLTKKEFVTYASLYILRRYELVRFELTRTIEKANMLEFKHEVDDKNETIHDLQVKTNEARVQYLHMLNKCHIYDSQIKFAEKNHNEVQKFKKVEDDLSKIIKGFNTLKRRVNFVTCELKKETKETNEEKIKQFNTKIIEDNNIFCSIVPCVNVDAESSKVGFESLDQYVNKLFLQEKLMIDLKKIFGNLDKFKENYTDITIEFDINPNSTKYSSEYKEANSKVNEYIAESNKLNKTIEDYFEEIINELYPTEYDKL